MAKNIFTQGRANPKLEKGYQFGFKTLGLSFSPSDISGTNLCKFASPQCKALCLNFAGRGQMSMVQKARLKRTLEFLSDKTIYCERLSKEIKKGISYCDKRELGLAIRLNVLSDVNWKEVSLKNGNNLFQEFSEVQFYDYTKDYQKLIENPYKNYHLTFSRSEKNEKDCIKALANGNNVAVVFSTKKGQPLPKEYLGCEVIDGDIHDLRFLDKKGVVVGLRAKGKAKKMTKNGFVVQV